MNDFIRVKASDGNWSEPSAGSRPTLTEIAAGLHTDKGTGPGDAGHPHRYTFIYEHFFEPLRDRPIRLLEVGVYKGASLRMWEEFFPAARILGIDIDPGCQAFATARSQVRIGSATDPAFVAAAIRDCLGGGIDVVIDDGSHILEEQIDALHILFPYLSEGGLYFVEDICCGRFADYRTNRYSVDSFVEYAADLAEQVTFFKGFASPVYHSVTDTRHLEAHGISAPPTTYWNENLYSVQLFHNLCLLIKQQQQFPHRRAALPPAPHPDAADVGPPDFARRYAALQTDTTSEQVTDLEHRLAEAERRTARAEVAALTAQGELQRVRTSVSWRLTRPLRALGDRVAAVGHRRQRGTPAPRRRFAPLTEIALALALRFRSFRRYARALHGRGLMSTETLRMCEAVRLLRTATLFDRDWYRQAHGLSAWQLVHPVIDYVWSTRSQPRRPNRAFDEDLYLKNNPEVGRDIAKMNYISGFHHFLKTGEMELGRVMSRRLSFELNGRIYDYDPAAFLEDHQDIAGLVTRQFYRSGLDFLMGEGYDEIAEGQRSFYASRRFVQKLATIDGEAPSGPHEYVCLFAHYDQDGLIDDYVVHYLKTLRRLGIDILFISATQTEAELAKIKPLCLRIIVKNEAGRDFGSWYLALKDIEATDFPKYRYLIFANDSVYFPVRSPEPMLQTMRQLDFQMWGITDTRETGVYHLQSYFLVFDETAQTLVLPEFLKRFEACAYLSKWGQIQEFEFGLTSIARHLGLRVGAYCSVDTIHDKALRTPEMARWRKPLRLGTEALNPTHDLWDLLISHWHCPVLKIELLRDNPKEIEVEGWNRLVDTNHINPGVIQGHLKRMQVPPRLAAGLSAKVETRLSTAGDAVVQAEVAGRGFGRSPRIALFAHFDPQGIIDDHVITSLDALAAAGNDLVFVTACDDPKQLQKIRDRVATTLIKPSSVETDFGSWYLALKTHAAAIAAYDTVIWMNDSGYFPLFDPKEMFGAMDARRLDFWGINDGYLGNWHIFSWFWAFGRKLIEGGCFENYINEYNPSYLKWDTILNFEIRIPLMLRQRGYRCGSLIESDDLYNYLIALRPPHKNFLYRKDFNMLHDFWDLIIEKYRCPAIKVELLRDNPLGIDISSAPEFLAEKTTYDVSLIRAHLRRIKGAAPGHRPRTAAAGARAVAG